MGVVMSTDYFLSLHVKRDDNAAYSSTYDELPNRYEEVGSQYFDGRDLYLLGRAAKKLLDKKSNGQGVARFVRLDLEDREFLESEIAKEAGPEDQELVRDILDILDEWYSDAKDKEPSFDLYLFWT